MRKAARRAATPRPCAHCWRMHGHDDRTALPPAAPTPPRLAVSRASARRRRSPAPAWPVWKCGQATWTPGSRSPRCGPRRFETPAGTPLAMQSFRGKPLLLNFWATWCPPCVEEMPLLDAFFRQNAATAMASGRAGDRPAERGARRSSQRTPVSYPIGLAGLGGTELAEAWATRAAACRSRSSRRRRARAPA